MTKSKFVLTDKAGKTYIRGSYPDCLNELERAQPEKWHRAMQEKGWSIDKPDEVQERKVTQCPQK